MLKYNNYHEWFRAVRAHIVDEWWPCFDPDDTKEPPYIPPLPEPPSALSSSAPASTPAVEPASGATSATSTQWEALSTEELDRQTRQWTLYNLMSIPYRSYEKELLKIRIILVNTVPHCYYPSWEIHQSPPRFYRKSRNR